MLSEIGSWVRRIRAEIRLRKIRSEKQQWGTMDFDWSTFKKDPTESVHVLNRVRLVAPVEYLNELSQSRRKRDKIINEL